MKFEDVVHNGVLQAHERLVDIQGRPYTPGRRLRLLEYKGDRIERSLIAAMNRGAQPLIIWD